MALTLGAAAVTLIVIIGVVAGPSVVGCFNADSGMGQCLRGEMVEAGILPQPAVAAVDATAPVAPAAPTTTEPSTALAAPQLEVTEPAAAADSLVAATFGLLRAEPDGSVVIAGSGTPGSEVQVYADEGLLGTATVEPSGDWVLVPDAPLPPGGLEITLGEAGKSGRAEDSFVVAINDDKSSEPLVVASKPGAASAILQGIEQPSHPTQLAAATEPVAVPVTPAAPASLPVASAQPEAENAPVADLASPVAEAPAQPPAVTSATEPAAEPAPQSAAPTIAPEPVVPATAPADTPPAPATPEIAVASADPVVAEPAPTAPVLPRTPPTIDAIEIEGNGTFFAGAGPEGGDIRLYIDDTFVADAKVADGRWLVEAGPVLKKPNQRVRIDLLQPGTAEVASRAEVNFAVDLPAAAAAAPPAATTSTAEAPPSNDVATANVQTPPAAPSDIEVATPNSATPARPISPSASPSVESTTAAMDAPPTSPAPETAATTADAAIPTMTAVAVGDPEAERFASGKAIIRRGDNLWTIAKRVYGEGIKYTTIYEANVGQIRDPDRIYPGQVFGLPEGTAD